ncbi:MAG TPA: LpxD N-terminal domain-containing protein, partial [bacterium]|nr:LpxD N-terminal domain-containing protein [bacterium]
MTPASRAPAKTLGEIALAAQATVEGSPDTVIHGVAALDDAQPGELSFLAHPRYEAALAITKASAVLVMPGVACP